MSVISSLLDGVSVEAWAAVISAVLIVVAGFVIRAVRIMDKQSDHNSGSTVLGQLSAIRKASEDQLRELRDWRQESRDQQYQRREEHAGMTDELHAIRSEQERRAIVDHARDQSDKGC